MKKIKLLTLLLTFSFILSTHAVSLTNGRNSAIGVNQTADYTVAIVYSTGGLGDQSFNDAAKRGIDAALVYAENNSLTMDVDTACESACDDDDVTTNIKAFADDTDVVYDIIIGIGFTALDGINASALAHPTQNFLIIDETVDEANVKSITFKEEEGSFLVGAMAAMVSTTGKLAFLGGLAIPLIIRFAAGFEHGARVIDPDIKVLVSYSPDPTNPFVDLEGGERVATQWYKDGVDVVFAAAGGTGIGTYTAAEKWNADNTDKVYAIGVDSYSDHLSPGNILASMIKNVDFAVEDTLVDVLSESFASGKENRGLEDYGTDRPGVDISNMSEVAAVRDAIFEGTTTRMEKVQALKAEVLAGTITVRDDFDAGGKFDFGGSEDEGIPLPTAYIFFSLFVTAVVVKRFRK